MNEVKLNMDGKLALYQLCFIHLLFVSLALRDQNSNAGFHAILLAFCLHALMAAPLQTLCGKWRSGNLVWPSWNSPVWCWSASCCWETVVPPPVLHSHPPHTHHHHHPAVHRQCLQVWLHVVLGRRGKVEDVLCHFFLFRERWHILVSTWPPVDILKTVFSMKKTTTIYGKSKSTWNSHPENQTIKLLMCSSLAMFLGWIPDKD